jgi:hypothetical protein
LDEINWLGRGDSQFSNKLAGWIDDKFSSHTGYLGRISWNMTLDELPVRDALQFFGTRRSRISLYEQLSCCW